jgi:hypothetical protein
MIWFLNRFRPGGESSREFIGETGLAGLTDLKTPPMRDRSSTGLETRSGSVGSPADRRARYSVKVGKERMPYLCGGLLESSPIKMTIGLSGTNLMEQDDLSEASRCTAKTVGGVGFPETDLR